MSSSESGDDDANIPPADECERRCQEFAAITDTDTACAMFFLQDRDWDVQRALDAYFEQSGKAAPPATTSTSTTQGASAEASSSKEAEDPEPHRIRLLSWNIDGLDTNNTLTRARAVCKIIIQENPDVVFLQEVVPDTVKVIEKNCPQYQLISAGKQGYFTVMLLRITSVAMKSYSVNSFFSSIMGRNLLQVKATVKGVEMDLLTTHLESTATHADERKRQLQKAFNEVKEAPSTSTVVFGGDLNLRDKELQQLGGVPEGLYDLWEVTGQRPEAKFTWDMMKNDNLEFSGKFRPRARFDRLYLRQPAGPKAIRPVYFELVGIQRLESCKRFPSDHWGILSHFDKVET